MTKNIVTQSEESKTVDKRINLELCAVILISPHPTPSQNMLLSDRSAVEPWVGELRKNQNRNEMNYCSIDSIKITILKIELNHI